MITTAHKDTTLEQHVDIKINNEDIQLELQVDRIHSNSVFSLLAAE